MRKSTIEKRTLQRNTVLKAAAKMFAERGFGGTSLGDVAKDLGISRPALYYYFSSKEEILSSLVDEVSVKSMKLIEDKRSQDLAPVSKLHDMIHDQLLFVMRNKLSYMVVVKTEEELVAETRKLNLEAKKAVLDGFRGVIREGIAQGHFRKIDPSVAALGIIGICSWCAWWFKDDGRLRDTEAAAQLTQMALASIVDTGNNDAMRDEIGRLVTSLEDTVASLTSLQKKY